MGDHQAYFLLAGLFQNAGEIAVAGDVVLAFVDIDECRKALVRRERRPLCCGLCDQGDEEAAEDFGAILFKQVLGGINQDDFAAVHFLEDIELALGVREHPLERLIFKNAVEPAQHLAFGFGELRAVEFIGEERARRALKFGNVLLVFLIAARLHQFEQGVNGRIRNVQKRPGHEAKDDRLLAGHFRA